MFIQSIRSPIHGMQQQHGYFILVGKWRRIVVPLGIGEKVVRLWFLRLISRLKLICCERKTLFHD
jgi:hypothetical protein